MLMDTAYKFLPNINSPADLKQLDAGDLPKVCDELRDFIIDALSCNPGHFAASLGVIELTVALHYVFDTPYDRIVWDVGHQAYAHKILTGRRDRFGTNRKFKGLKPFPSPDESEYDTFTCGHASNSISVALGMAVAAAMKHEERQIVAVIGDGAMTGGLAFEGLNNASTIPNNLLIILNDNDIAIDRTVGGLKEYLIRLNTNTGYNKLRYSLWNFAKALGVLDEKHKNKILRFNNSLKSMLSDQQNIFEGLNIRYFGPINGHDVNNLVRVLNELKNHKGPKLLHIHTVKGKGYEFAEQAATVWHAPGLFDKDTGERKVSSEEGQPPLYQDVFGKTLLDLARKNDKIIGITPAMATGCSMNILMREMPHRAFDVGIAEGHAVTFSGGLAKEGLLPFCNIYSSFAQRAYDNIIHDVAIARLNVVLCLDRAGLVGEDGPTHHGAFDIACLRCVPNLTIASPYDEHELRNLMFTAQLPDMGPFVIRYPRGRGNLIDWENEYQQVTVGTGRCLKQGNTLAIITLGPIGQTVKAIIDELPEDERSKAGLYDLRFVKPLDAVMLHEIGNTYKSIMTVEDGIIAGGAGAAVLEFMEDNGYHLPVHRFGLPDRFVEHGPVSKLYETCGLDKASLRAFIETQIK